MFSARVSAHTNLGEIFSVLANNMNKSAAYFRVSTNYQGEETLKVNGIIRRFLLSCYWYTARHEKNVISFINKKITAAEQLDRRCFLNDQGEYNSLFDSLQKYNQSLLRHQDLKINMPLVKQINILRRDDLKGLSPSTIFLGAENDREIPRENRHPHLAQDKPEIYQERRFSFKHGFSKQNIRLYPTDKTACGTPICHGEEAKSIFLNTQKERLLSLLGRICESTGKVFGYTITRFTKYHYNQHQETADQIYSHDRPLSPVGALEKPHENPLAPTDCVAPPLTSYWVGHATLLLSIPLKAQTSASYESFNIITDPVEGDLNALLYPRQTQFATPMEELPAPHVYLLSHNHLDHYSEPTIKKLIAQQPVMIVPRGDGHRYTKLKFANVVEVDWWDEQTISFKRDNNVYEMNIVATPARHWAGQGPCGGHDSSFLGYIIQGHEGGDIYFAGDTARLGNDDRTVNHVRMLREYYPNIRWNFQPGGPDEVRKDMKTSHQASVDALWMHVEMMLSRIHESKALITLDEFLGEAEKLKTIFMHTMTFKLGNLHLSDTKDSVQKVLALLQNSTDNEEMLPGDIKEYEWQVYQELRRFCQNLSFAQGEKLSCQILADLLCKTVLVPKIGSRLDLEAAKQDQKEKIYDSFEGLLA